MALKTVYCPYCGKQITTDDQRTEMYCGFCGKKFDISPKNPTVEVNANSIDSFKNSNAYIYESEQYYPNLFGWLDFDEYGNDIFFNMADKTRIEIENALNYSPTLITLLNSVFPKTEYVARLTNLQKQQLASGLIKLMTKTDGTTIATLVNSNTNQIISAVPLEKVSMSVPDISQAMTNLSLQIQMAQISNQIEQVQKNIDEIKQGQENDRLAMAYSCKEKLKLAMAVKNPELRNLALLKVAHDAEDSRNLLMLSQKSDIDYLMNQPNKSIDKFLKGDNVNNINSRINNIRRSVGVVEIMTLVEATAYKELGEENAAKMSLEYYSSYIERTYLNKKEVLLRLDSIDTDKSNIWSNTIPQIFEKTNLLSYNDKKLIGD